MGEVRGNFSGESRHHLHDGFDIRGDVGQTVLAMADAKVSSPFPSWSVGGQAEGLSLDRLRYIHMKVGRDARDRAFDARWPQLRDWTASWSGYAFAGARASRPVSRWAASTAWRMCI